MTPTELTPVLKQVAGADLEGVPLYLLDARELPQSLHNSTAIAYTGRTVDLAARDYLSAHGEWQGRGPAIVFHCEAIAEDAAALADGDPSLAAELQTERLIAVAMHELGHVLERPLTLLEPAAPVAEFQTGRVAAWCQSAPRLSVPWEFHDARFLRTTAHVVHRAQQLAGVGHISQNLVVNGQKYGLSPFASYCDALTPELENFHGTFAQLRETQPPTAFIEIWQNDLQNFAERLASVSQIVTALVDAHNLFRGEANDYRNH